MRIIPTLLLLSLLAGCGPTMSFKPPPHTGHYVNKTQNFCLQVPKEWEIRQGLASQIVVCLSPVQKGDNFRENLVVTSEPKNENLQALTDDVKKKVAAEVPGWEVKSEGQTPEGMPFVVGTHKQFGEDLTALVAVAPGTTSGLIFTFSAKTAEFATWEPIFREVLKNTHLDLKDCKEPTPEASVTPAGTPTP